MSPSLFNSVLEEEKRKWQSKGQLIQMREGEYGKLCTLRFAEDILGMAKIRRQLENMLRYMADAFARVGVEVHMGKTNTIANCEQNRGCKVTIHGPDAETCQSQGNHVLGKNDELHGVS